MLKLFFITLLYFLLNNNLIEADNYCPDRFAFDQINAVIYDNSLQRVQLTNLSLYHLDRYQHIDVTKANVSVLCEGMIKEFYNLQYLYLININLTQIQPLAFDKLPKLTHLSLAVNNLTQIKRHYFHTIPTLKILHLSANLIEYINDDAFDDLINLKKIYLDRNKLYEISSNWFLKTTKLSLIDLSHNYISKLQSGAFLLHENSKIDIRLQRNMLEIIQENSIDGFGTFENVPYVILHLENNNLTDIDYNFLESMDRFQSNIILNRNQLNCISDDVRNLLLKIQINLHIVENPLSCGCMELISKFIQTNQLRSTLYYNTTLDCPQITKPYRPFY